jgi:ADP-heptose:LPS heptosyltransferase
MTSGAGQIPFDQIRRILVIKWSALGDIAIASAIMEDISRAFPRAEIHLNTQPGGLKLFKNDPRFKEVFAIDVRMKGRRWANSMAWISKVRSGRYDMLIDLQRSDHSRFLLVLLWLSGGAPRIRLGNRGGFPYTVQPGVRDPQSHSLVMMRSTLESAGIAAHTSHPVFYPSATQIERVQTLREEHQLHDDRYAVLLPGSHASGPLKRWGTQHYADLARLLHERGMESIVLIGGPDEVDVCKQISAVGDYVVDMSSLELLQIAPMCKGAAVIIGNDTGNAHFAAGADRPMLVICGPTNPLRVKPIGDKVHAVQAVLPCINCYSKTCSNPDHHACMKAITPVWVADSVPQLISGNFVAGNSNAGKLRCF